MTLPTKPHLKVIALLAAALLPTLSAAQQPAAIHQMYVFGDSYSDIGEGYLDGNGLTAVAYLAQRLGFKLLPSNATPTKDQSLDFAISGAQSGSGLGMRTEGAFLGFGDFAARVRSHAIAFDPQTTLFFLAGGLNDGNLPTETTVANLEGEIRTLYSLGARRFTLANLPTAIPGFSAVGKRLNPGLEKIPAALAPELSGSQIVLSHWGSFFDEVILHPAQYGIQNTTDACAGRAIHHQDTTPCLAPETYFFYHAEHPSTATHKAVGDKLYEELTATTPQAAP